MTKKQIAITESKLTDLLKKLDGYDMLLNKPITEARKTGVRNAILRLNAELRGIDYMIAVIGYARKWDDEEECAKLFKVEVQ